MSTTVAAIGSRPIASLPPRQSAARAQGASQRLALHPAAAWTSGSNGSSSGASARRRAAAAAADAAGAASTVAEPAPASSSSSKTVPQSDGWELDFCSRPILDERGKKVGWGRAVAAGGVRGSCGWHSSGCASSGA